VLTGCSFESGQNIIIQYNYVYGHTGTGLVYNVISNSKILHNEIAGQGIGDWDGNPGGNELAFNKIYGGSGEHCIYITSPNCDIHDNECGPSNTYGITFKAKSFVYNNYIHDIPTSGIGVHWGESGSAWKNPAGSRVYNNTIENIPGVGIYPSPRATSSGGLTDIEFTNNTITGCGEAILIDPVDHPTSDLTFALNNISDADTAIDIATGSSTISNIKFLANNFTSISGTVFNIRSNTNPTDTTIAYNDATNANPSTMLLDGGTNTIVYDNIPIDLLPDQNVPAEKIPPPS
jgi:hypothetical protein